MRRDLYFFFLEGSWTQAIASFAFLYLAINVLFAGLFMLDPEGIGGTDSPDFASAFFLSVQTFGTIGYGVLHPKSELTNLIVTAEAATSMIFVALATGTVLAKAARPRAAVLFSRVMVVHTLNGLPTLVVRAANARGNDVAEATVSVALVMDTTTAEGHHMRRVHDLKLVRDRQPMFGLSWSIMHVIDGSSPLHGLDLRHPRNLVGMVVTLMGHDGTYNQTIYARQLYEPSQLRPGHRFVDVVGQTGDGRLILDLTRFHDTEPALL
jgi:inward rectifier potassium channel